MKKELMAGVAEFAAEVFEFDTDFEENGPMVEGLEAREASDRFGFTLILGQNWVKDDCHNYNFLKLVFPILFFICETLNYYYP